MGKVLEPSWTSTAEVLLTDGNWTIEKLRGSPPPASAGFRSMRSLYYSLLKHVCYPDGRGQPTGQVVHQVVVYPDGDTTKCWRCYEGIPEGIVAVWKFQNWEHLEYGG